MKYIFVIIFIIFLYPNFLYSANTDFKQQIIGITQCNDGIDNDGDGLIDFASDPDCVSWEDNNEFSELENLSELQNDFQRDPQLIVPNNQETNNIIQEFIIDIGDSFRVINIDPCENFEISFNFSIWQALAVRLSSVVVASDLIDPCLTDDQKYIYQYPEDIVVLLVIVMAIFTTFKFLIYPSIIKILNIKLK
jgi:hypothetical protein